MPKKTKKGRSKLKLSAARKPVSQPSRLRITRSTAAELLGGWSDRQFERLEARGMLTPFSRGSTVFYFIDDFRAVLQPASKLARELASLKLARSSGEIGSLSKEGVSVFIDGDPLTITTTATHA